MKGHSLEEKRGKIQKKKGIFWRLLFFPAMMIFLEYYFRSAVYDEPEAGFLYPCLFGAAFGMVLALTTVIFRNKGNAVMSYMATITVTVFYISQMLYYNIFGTFFSVTSIKGAGNALDFKSELFQAMKDCAIYEIGMLLPLFLLIISGIFFISFERPVWKKNTGMAAGCVMVAVFTVLSLNLYGREVLTPYSLFHGRLVMELSMRKLGVMVTMGKDIYTLIFEDDYDISDIEFNDSCTVAGQVRENGYAPQIDETLDLRTIYDNVQDEDIKAITAYVSNREPTYENQYTGRFEGYNLIFITAESLSPYMVREDWTPTLYKLMHEGFVFTNYYNPEWNKSTIDAEYVTCLSQYPAVSAWSLEESADTCQPYALGNALSDKGYAAKAYHNYDFRFYDRRRTHPNMGYDFKAIDYGLMLAHQDEYYSDLEMMQAVYGEFTAAEPFHAYFMTYSGHLPYTFRENDVSAKNRNHAEQLVKESGYDETLTAYVAAQLELEYALEWLIGKLDEDGLLERTLFVVTPDHYPYPLLNSGAYDIFAGKNVSDNQLDLCHSCFSIWNSEIEEPIIVDKLCASVDILPTVLNLMGVNYDSRLLAGRDMLDDGDGEVLLLDYSFLMEAEGSVIGYDSQLDEVFCTDATARALADGMLYEQIIHMEQIFYISDKMLKTDYYRYIYGEEKE